MSGWVTAVSLAIATLASEDLAAIGAAALAASGQADLYVAIGAVTAGIYVGDLLLFVCGRATGRIEILGRWIGRRWSPQQLAALTATLDRRLPWAILTSRVVPGTRLPLYVAAGMFSRRPAAFCLWTFVAVAIWTPLLMSGVLILGQAFAGAAHWYLTWAPVVGLAVAAQVARHVAGSRRTS